MKWTVERNFKVILADIWSWFAGSGNSWNDSYMEKEHNWIHLRGLDWGKTYDIAVVAHEDGVGRVYSDIQLITIEPMKGNRVCFFCFQYIG